MADSKREAEMIRLPDVINQKINNAGAELAKGDEMSEELKPPKTIYLQWDADPLAENTWSEDRINDDDIKYTRSDMEWIPASEPPKVEGEYLVIDAFKQIYSALYRRDEWSPTFFNGIITHWMPLPEVPKEEE